MFQAHSVSHSSFVGFCDCSNNCNFSHIDFRLSSFLWRAISMHMISFRSRFRLSLNSVMCLWCSPLVCYCLLCNGVLFVSCRCVCLQLLCYVFLSRIISICFMVLYKTLPNFVLAQAFANEKYNANCNLLAFPFLSLSQSLYTQRCHCKLIAFNLLLC